MTFVNSQKQRDYLTKEEFIGHFATMPMISELSPLLVYLEKRVVAFENNQMNLHKYIDLCDGGNILDGIKRSKLKCMYAVVTKNL